MDKKNVFWGLVLMGLVILWALVSGPSRAFFPLWIPVMALYKVTAVWGWSNTPYQLLIDLVPTLLFMAGTHRAVYYATEWERPTYPLLVAVGITLLAYALLEFVFPAFSA